MSTAPRRGPFRVIALSAVTTVRVPDIGDFKDIPVIEILVKSGDRVSKDSPLIVLESDKATLDVPSPEEGTIRELKIAIGDRVSVGSAILTLTQVANESQSSPQPPPAATPAAAMSAPENTPSDADVAARPVLRIVQEAAPAASGRAAHGSPSIRRMAREFGVDLTAVHGSGPRGRILREDLQQFVKTALAASPRSRSDSTGGIDGDGSNSLKLAPWPQVDFAKFGPVERAPLSKIRKISAANLARNAVLIPHVTNFEDADITELDAFRRKLNMESRPTDPKLTILPFLMKAVGVTLAKHPAFNASLDGDEVVLKRYVHIGFAVDTPNGLVVPVIRDVDTKGVSQIAGEAAALSAQARDGKLKSADMQGGCFTVSSLGGIGGTGFTPIINAPEVAILGVTRAQMRPIWDDKEFRPRLILPLMLSWDHRVVDGVAAARFLVHLSGLLEDFRRVIL
jgi:pyruvate dehydrogenase E2 component (dihydrolipoamide acetyltransferase)